MPRLRSLTRSVDDPAGLLVLLPGYGDRPEAFLSRADDLDPHRRWTVVVLEPCLPLDSGPAWYRVDDDGPVEHELDAAVVAVRDELVHLTRGSSTTPASVVLAGFSQGGALALATLLDPAGGPTPRAVAVVAGYLPVRADASIDLGRAVGRPVLLAHGDDDGIVEPIRGRSAARALDRAGADVTWAETVGGHRFEGPLLEPLRHWLGALADPASPDPPI